MEDEWRCTRRTRKKALQLLQLALQAALAFAHPFLLFESAEVELFHDLEHVNLEQHDVHERAARFDVQRAVGPRLGVDETSVQLKDAQKLDEVAANEFARAHACGFIRAIQAFEIASLFTTQRAQRGEVFELGRGETQRAKMIELGIDLRQQPRQRKLRLIATDESVLGLRIRMPVQEG